MLNKKCILPTSAAIALSMGLFIVDARTEEAVANLPVLNECVKDVVARIKKLPKQASITAKYVHFDNVFASHPTLAGYIELKSDDASKEDLVAVGNGLIRKCQTGNSIAFSKDDPSDINKLLQFIEAIRNDGDEPVYLIDQEEELILRFSDRN